MNQSEHLLIRCPWQECQFDDLHTMVISCQAALRKMLTCFLEIDDKHQPPAGHKDEMLLAFTLTSMSLTDLLVPAAAAAGVDCPMGAGLVVKAMTAVSTSTNDEISWTEAVSLGREAAMEVFKGALVRVILLIYPQVQMIDVIRTKSPGFDSFSQILCGSAARHVGRTAAFRQTSIGRHPL